MEITTKIFWWRFIDLLKFSMLTDFLMFMSIKSFHSILKFIDTLLSLPMAKLGTSRVWIVPVKPFPEGLSLSEILLRWLFYFEAFKGDLLALYH